MLSQLKIVANEEVGLYRVDGLTVFHARPRVIEQKKKKICELFRKKGLKITIQANKKIINFLDVTLDLQSGKHYPYLKEGNVSQYVNAKSNHPPNVVKQIPESINRRLSDISSDEIAFNEAAPIYQEALEKSGHNYKLKFQPRNEQRKRRSRNRNITWFNPPFDLRVRTNLGRQFLRIVDECFHKGHPLRPIFNRNKLRLSYSCMPNVKSVIDSHNKNLMREKPPQDERKCNCRKKEECPLQNQCLSKGIIYQATVTADQGEKKHTWD